MSIAQAQRLAGCSEPTVLKAIREQQLVQRTGLPRGFPSLERTSVERWVEVRRAEAARRAAEPPRRPKSAGAAEPPRRPKSAPPQDGQT